MSSKQDLLLKVKSYIGKITRRDPICSQKKNQKHQPIYSRSIPLKSRNSIELESKLSRMLLCKSGTEILFREIGFAQCVPKVRSKKKFEYCSQESKSSYELFIVSLGILGSFIAISIRSQQFFEMFSFDRYASMHPFYKIRKNI